MKNQKRVVKFLAFSICLITILLTQGCSSEKIQTVGFLSDYSMLEEESSHSLIYMNEEALAKYPTFIVDPIVMDFKGNEDMIEYQTKGDLNQQEIKELADYMHAQVIGAIKDSGHETTDQPAAGVARIKIAVTDMDKTSIASLLPQAKVFGAGIGGATMEAEIIDSMTEKQIAAIVESKSGSRIPFANLGDWNDAKQVMHSWASRFEKRLEETD